MNESARPRALSTLLVALITALLSWAAAGLMFDPVPWQPPAIAPYLQILAALLSMLALAAIPAGAVRAFVSRTNRARSVFVLALGLSWIGGWGAREALRPSHEVALRQTLQKANRVVGAIESFQRDTGQPPASIAALMPRYLTRSDLPRGGTTLRYASITSSDRIWFFWDYDLARAAWPSGAAWGPTLTVAFSGQGRVREADVWFLDGLPPTAVTFDSVCWAQGDTLQVRMALNVRDSGMLLIRDTSEVVRLLGNPDRRRRAHSGEWFLAVARTDVFGDYSALILDSPTRPDSDAGNAIRIGRWWLCEGCYERLPDP